MLERKESVAATLRLCGSIEPGSVSAAQRSVAAWTSDVAMAHGIASAASATLNLIMWRSLVRTRSTLDAMIADAQIACNDERRRGRQRRPACDEAGEAQGADRAARDQGGGAGGRGCARAARRGAA